MFDIARVLENTDVSLNHFVGEAPTANPEREQGTEGE